MTDMREDNSHTTNNNDADTNAPSAALNRILPNDLSLHPEDLQRYSWDQLLEMFSSALKEHEQIDRELQEQTIDLLKVLYIHVTSVTCTRRAFTIRC